MKKVSLIITSSFLSLLTYAQVDTTSLNRVTGKVMSGNNDLLGKAIGILILVGIVFMIGHMLYSIYKAFRFNKNFAVSSFKEARQIAGKNEESSEEENEQCNELLNQIFYTWSNIDEVDNDGNEYRKPKKMKEIKKSGILLQQIVEIAPTDHEIVKRLNQYKEVVRTNEKRSFDGSWKLIILGSILSLVVGLIAKTETHGFIMATITEGAFFWVPTLLYFTSSLTPVFLIEKRTNRGGGNMSSGLVVLALTVIGSGQTIRYRYSDGSHEDDNTSHFIALIIGAAILVAVALTISFWAIFNYLRNYVLYF